MHKGPSNYRFSTQEKEGTTFRRAPTPAPPRLSAQRALLGEILLTRLVHHHFLFVDFLSVSLQSQPGYLTSECCGLNQCLLSFPLGCSEDSKWGRGGEGGHTLYCSGPRVCQIYQPAHTLCVWIKYEQ